MTHTPGIMILFGLALVTASWTLLTLVALLRRGRPPLPPPAVAEPVTILKPVRGVDVALEQNLRSFFEQRYPHFEIVFGVEGADDPALAVLERVRADYPQVNSRVLVHEGGRALNPKVRNLLAMLDSGTHDVVVVSDSNIRVPVDYLATTIATLQQPGVGLVTHPIIGAAVSAEASPGASSCGSVVEQSYLTTNVVASIVMANDLLRHAAVVGKSMMFRRGVLDRLGGMESLSNVLAEDYIMGRMFQHAGYQVVLARQPVINTCAEASVAMAFDRMVRWSMLRARVQPAAYLCEPLSSPLWMLLIAPWQGAHAVLWVACALSLIVVRDLCACHRVGLRLTGRSLLLSPARELMWHVAWVVALGRRHVAWRGHRLRVSAGTRLYQIPGVR